MPKVKRTNIPNVISGGIATPLGNNLYLMIGRTHEQGGIDIGNAKNGLEVENGEVLKTNKNNVKVFSAKPILNGNSPAELVIKGLNPENVFNAQERFKDRNHFKDDGTKARFGRFSRVKENDSPTKEISGGYEDYVNKTITKHYKDRPSTAKYYIPYLYDKEIKVNGAGRMSSNMLDSIAVNANKAKIPFNEALGLAVQETHGGAMPTIAVPAGMDKDKVRAHFNMSYARNYGGIPAEFLINDYEYYKQGYKGTKYNDLSNIESPLQHGFTMYKKGLYNPGDKNHKNDVKAAGDKAISSPDVQKWIKENGQKYNIKRMGGLSRKQDYGSKKKPYPNVNSSDFAGGNRSYPIPTKADAIDALRLAGLHGRSDVKSKIYAKYPSLRKAELGTNIEDMQLENLNLQPAIVTALSPNTIAAMNYTANLMKDIKEERRNNTKKKETKEQIIKFDTSVPKLTNFRRKAPFGTKYPYGKDMLISVNKSDLNPENPNYNKYTIDDKGNRKVYPNQVDIKPLQVINGQLVPTDRSLPNLQKLPTDVLTTQSSIVGGNTIKPTLPIGSLVENYKPVDNGLIPKLKHLENPDTYSDTGLIRRNLNIENIPKLDSLPSGNLIMPKSQDKIIGFNGYTVGDAAQDAVNLSKVKATNPFTGRQPKTASGSGWSIGSDLIRGAADLAGSIASYKINKDMINKMKVNNYTPYQRYKLKTNYNINPQLDSTREQVNAMIDESKHNTASSRTDLARRQQYRNLGVRNTNELYGQKENVETQLINQDILNAQRTSQQNTQLVNDYLRRKTEMDNKVAELNAENTVSLVQNAAGVIGDYYDRRETRNREALDRAVIAASNPNAISYMDNELPKLARQFGYRPLSFNFGRFRKNK
jgi:hypothetical protein